MNEDVEFPMRLTDDFIDDIMKHKPKVTYQKIANKPHVGVVNGLYATSGSDVGGIMPIQTMRTLSKNKLELVKCTGLLKNMIEESIHIAMSVSLNILPKNILKKIMEDKTEYQGLHIHVGDQSSPKQGPSAGCAVAVSIISRLCEIPVRHDVALTGELTLRGICERIGGVRSKLNGALRANVKKVLLPESNKDDYLRIINDEDDIDLMSSGEFMPPNEEIPKLKKKKTVKNKTIKNDLKVIFAKDIYDVLKHVLVKNDLKFNKIY
jgi:ATP-dependent Lon protease